jgi:transposase
MIQVPAVRERCAGIDVGKKTLAVATIVGPADQDGVVTKREFGTTVSELSSLKNWLTREACLSVAMESTGSYWIPVKNVLEEGMEITLVCAKKHKPKKGEKTDFQDAINLAHLHRHGMLKGSYLPERRIIELRDLTRRRKKLLSNLNAEKNRIQKVLEVANVKIGSVVSDVFGVSGQQMLSALLSGEKMEAGEIAEMAKKRLRLKIRELTEALEGHQMNDHHRFLIQQSIEHIVLLDQQLERLEARIEEWIKPYEKQYQLLQTIPGIKTMIAAAVLAEIGADMSQFESSGNLCSWAGICPGNNCSAGKRKSSRIKKANKFLLAALVQASWAAARKRDSIFQKKFHRWRNKLGEKKANIAISHSLLTVVYTILKEGRPFRESNSREMHDKERAKLIHHHAKRLRQLGADETVINDIVANLLAQAQPPQPPEIPLADEIVDPGPCQEASCAAEISPTTGNRRPPGACRGALGFRARTTRKQYSTVKDLLATTPTEERPRIKRAKQPKPR